MPFWLAKLQALLTWPLPNSLRPVTLDQVRMLQRDNIVSAAAKSEGRTLAGLGIACPARRRRHRADVSGALPRARPVRQLPHLSRTAD